MVEAARDARLSILLTRHSNRVSTNASLRGRETRFCGAETKGPETVPAIQSADCRDKMRAQIAASLGDCRRVVCARYARGALSSADRPGSRRSAARSILRSPEEDPCPLQWTILRLRQWS